MLSLEVIYYMATENKYVFAFFFPTQLHWVFIAVHRLSLVEVSYSRVAVLGLLIAVASSLVMEHGL